jgi:hypothetical protein
VNVSKFSFRQAWDDRVEVGAAGQPRSAVYQFNPSLPKPCVHPLRTAKGHQLSGFEMSDHIWHRGLWFTIKFIRETNFWEEQSPFGIQVSKAQPICELISADAMRTTHLLDWTSDATGVVFNEKRTLTFHLPASGVGAIDWTSQLHATQDLTLDRTPFTTWGGYGGMSFRASRELHDSSFLLPNGETVTALTGQRHDWVVLQSSVDEGPGERVSVGMIDHPANPRGQSPWYCKCAQGFTFMNAAFLFHEPMTLRRGETLRFCYQILYRDGLWNAQDFSKLAAEFRESEGER